MSIISRLTTWTIGQVLKAADLNGEFNNITNLLNNLDAATTTWTNVKVATLNVTTKATLPFGPFQANVSATTVSQTSVSSNAYTNTALAATITPTSASNRIKISVSGDIFNNNSATTARLSVKRGSTEVTSGGSLAEYHGFTGGSQMPVSFVYVDSPATTSATTYTVCLLSTDNSSAVFFPNNNGTNPTGVIILEEIV